LGLTEPAEQKAVVKARRTPSGRKKTVFAATKASPTLAWEGRSWAPGAPELLRPDVLAVERVAGAGAQARLHHGDALSLAGALVADELAGTVDLVYLDPPFASARDYQAEARLDGPADGRVVRSFAYEDTWARRDGGLAAYLDMMAPRIEALARLLSPTGSMWVHLDWRASYLVRVILDEIFGRERFINEIIWRRAPNLGRQAQSQQFGRVLDTLLVYGREKASLRPPTRLEPVEPGAIRRDELGRPFTSAPRGDYTDASVARLDAEGRIHRTASGKVYVKYFLVPDASGTLCRERRVDALWTDVPPLRHAAPSERTGYPTQKPLALLERIVACASPPGGLVVDAFAGSGTTGVAAARLGRRSVLGDVSPVAIATCRARLLREGCDLRLDRDRTTPEPAALPARVKLHRGEGKTRRVELVSPREPLAWTVGVRAKDGAVEGAWHAERAWGKKAVPASLEALVTSAGPLAARVYGDDGRVATVEP
jgi:DNA modification methylase